MALGWDGEELSSSRLRQWELGWFQAVVEGAPRLQDGEGARWLQAGTEEAHQLLAGTEGPRELQTGVAPKLQAETVGTLWF